MLSQMLANVARNAAVVRQVGRQISGTASQVAGAVLAVSPLGLAIGAGQNVIAGATESGRNTINALMGKPSATASKQGTDLSGQVEFGNRSKNVLIIGASAAVAIVLLVLGVFWGKKRKR